MLSCMRLFSFLSFYFLIYIPVLSTILCFLFCFVLFVTNCCLLFLFTQLLVWQWNCILTTYFLNIQFTVWQVLSLLFLNLTCCYDHVDCTLCTSIQDVAYGMAIFFYTTKSDQNFAVIHLHEHSSLTI